MKSLYQNKVYDKLFIKELDEMVRKSLKLSTDYKYYEAFTASRWHDDGTPYGIPYRHLNNDQIEFLKQNYKDVVYVKNQVLGYWIFKK